MMRSLRRLWWQIRKWHDRIERMWPPRFFSGPPDGTRVRQIIVECPSEGVIEGHHIGVQVTRIARGYAPRAGILRFGFRETPIRLAPGEKIVVEYVKAEDPNTELRGCIQFLDGKIQCFGLPPFEVCGVHGKPPWTTRCCEIPLPTNFPPMIVVPRRAVAHRPS